MTPPDDSPGDELALRLGRHSDFLRSLASRLVRHESDAEDAVQDTFAAALTSSTLPTHLSRLRPLAPWLAKVLRRRVGHGRRKVAQRPPHTGTEALVERRDGVGSATDAAATVELSQRLLTAIEGLGEPYTETLVLRFYEGLNPRDIAARMGVPVNTVQTRLARALGRLRSRLDEETMGGRAGWMAAATGLLRDGGAVPPAGSPTASLPASPAAQVSSGGSASTTSWGSSAMAWFLATAAALLVGAGLYVAAIQSGDPGDLGAPSEMVGTAPVGRGPEAASARAGPGAGSGGRTQAVGVGGETSLGAPVTAAALDPETITILGTIEDLGTGQEIGTGRPAPEGTRVEYNLYYDETAPVGGREVFASAPSSGGLPFLEVDAEGRFELEAPRGGLAVLQLFVAGSPTLRRVTWKRLHDEIPTGEVEVALQRYPRGSLRGSLVDPSGSPMVGVEVSIAADEPIVETDAEGGFEFTHVENTANLHVPDEDYTILRRPETVQRPQGGWEDVTMIATAAGRLRIACVDENGEPTSARMIFGSLAPHEPHAVSEGLNRFYALLRDTGSDGLTTIERVPSGVKLALDARSLGVLCMGVDANGTGVADEEGDGVTPASAIVVPAGGELAITLRASRTFRVNGVVRTASGEPAAGVWVSVRRVEGAQQRHWALLDQVQTDPSGRYSMCFHPKDGVERVILETESQGDLPRAAVELALGGPRDRVVDLELRPAYFASGCVLSEGSEEPLGGASVIVRALSSDGTVISTSIRGVESNAEGVFAPGRIEPALAGGRVELLVEKLGFESRLIEGTVSSLAGVEVLLVPAPPGLGRGPGGDGPVGATGELWGRVPSTLGVEASRLCYSLRSSAGPVESRWAVNGKSIFRVGIDGRFRARDLAVGEYQLLLGTLAELRSGAPQRVLPVVIHEGKNGPLDLD